MRSTNAASPRSDSMDANSSNMRSTLRRVYDRPMPQPLPKGLLDLLRLPSPCFIATLMPDGSPQLTQTWVTTDGEHVVLNIVDGMQKAKNLARDTRIALN